MVSANREKMIISPRSLAFARMKRSVSFSTFPSDRVGITNRGGADHAALRVNNKCDVSPPEPNYQDGESYTLMNMNMTSMNRGCSNISDNTNFKGHNLVPTCDFAEVLRLRAHMNADGYPCLGSSAKSGSTESSLGSGPTYVDNSGSIEVFDNGYIASNSLNTDSFETGNSYACLTPNVYDVNGKGSAQSDLAQFCSGINVCLNQHGQSDISLAPALAITEALVQTPIVQIPTQCQYYQYPLRDIGSPNMIQTSQYKFLECIPLTVKYEGRMISEANQLKSTIKNEIYFAHEGEKKAHTHKYVLDNSFRIDCPRVHSLTHLGCDSRCSPALAAALGARGTDFAWNYIRGNLVDFSKNSFGSRLIQDTIFTVSWSIKHDMVEEMIYGALDLMSDVFGNYVVQCLMDFATRNQKERLFDIIMGRMIKLSTEAHGCRVIQKVLDFCEPVRRECFISEIIKNPDNLNACLRDEHGVHVLEKIIILLQRDVNSDMFLRPKRSDRFASIKSRRLEPEYLGQTGDNHFHRLGSFERSMSWLVIVEKVVYQNISWLAVDEYGYGLVQAILGDCERQRNERVAQCVDYMMTNMFLLATSQQGNFLLQHILDCGPHSLFAQIQEMVKLRALELSMHRFGSHLVEKAFLTGTITDVQALIDILLQSTKSPGPLEFCKSSKDSSAPCDSLQNTSLFFSNDDQPLCKFCFTTSIGCWPPSAIRTVEERN